MHPFMSDIKLSDCLKNFNKNKIQKNNFENCFSIDKLSFDGLVLNKINFNKIKKDFELISNFNHINLEPILNLQKNSDFIFFTTPFFIDNLENVWNQKLQFVKYNVSQMFFDFWNGLDFLKSKNICHGSIHENNLAYNGNNWYLSGLLSTKKDDNFVSGCHIKPIFQSRRFLHFNSDKSNSELNLSDDMWQLVLMYVITYYGSNPFFSKNYETNYNIYKGNCKEISNSVYGKYLKEILISFNEIKNNDYYYILEIFKNNTDNLLFLFEDLQKLKI
jgi:hypothetical protein